MIKIEDKVVVNLGRGLTDYQKEDLYFDLVEEAIKLAKEGDSFQFHGVTIRKDGQSAEGDVYLVIYKEANMQFGYKTTGMLGLCITLGLHHFYRK